MTNEETEIRFAFEDLKKIRKTIEKYLEGGEPVDEVFTLCLNKL